MIEDIHLHCAVLRTPPPRLRSSPLGRPWRRLADSEAFASTTSTPLLYPELHSSYHFIRAAQLCSCPHPRPCASSRPLHPMPPVLYPIVLDPAPPWVGWVREENLQLRFWHDLPRGSPRPAPLPVHELADTTPDTPSWRAYEHGGRDLLHGEEWWKVLEGSGPGRLRPRTDGVYCTWTGGWGINSPRLAPSRRAHCIAAYVAASTWTCSAEQRQYRLWLMARDYLRLWEDA